MHFILLCHLYVLLTRGIARLTVTLRVFRSCRLVVRLLLHTFLLNIRPRIPVLLGLARRRGLAVIVVAESRIRVVAFRIRRLTNVRVTSPRPAVHFSKYFPARSLGKAHVQIWQVSTVVLLVQDGLDWKRHQRVATNGHFLQRQSLLGFISWVINLPKCQFIHILGDSLRGALLSLNVSPPALLPGRIPAGEAVESFCYIRRRDDAPPHNSAISAGSIHTPALFTQLFFTIHPHLWLTGSPRRLPLARAVGKPCEDWPL